jgi:hypothetical protein
LRGIRVNFAGVEYSKQPTNADNDDAGEKNYPFVVIFHSLESVI